MSPPLEPNNSESTLEEPACIDRLHQEMNRRMSSVRKKVEARVVHVLNKYAVAPQVNADAKSSLPRRSGP